MKDKNRSNTDKRVLAKSPTVIPSKEGIQKKTLQIGGYIALDSCVSGNDKVKNKLRKKSNNPSTHLHVGIFDIIDGKGAIFPCHRKTKMPVINCPHKITTQLEPDEVIVYSITKHGEINIHKRLGSIYDPTIYSLVATHSHGLPHQFSQHAIELAQKAKVPSIDNYRQDLRDISLVTIDGEDAKDFDDAVWAAPDQDQRNIGGWRIIVAIADVSFYVQPKDALDQDAMLRGNSVYFADKVIPMLPEALSNEMCSLKPHEDRACLAVEMIVSASGKVKSHRFKRALMRSKARLTYEQMQKAIEGNFDKITKDLWDEVLAHLYGAYQSLKNAREQRGTLEIITQEKKIIFDKNGKIMQIVPQSRSESNSLIEEFMIAANVAAAKTLLAKKWTNIFRVHEKPDNLKVQSLLQLAKNIGLKIDKGKKDLITIFNNLLRQVDKTSYSRLMHELVLRSQVQARYSTINFGHFGLNLLAYCHFTSPIRRYADLVVHRSLVASLNLDDKQHRHPIDNSLEEVASHISTTERKAITAEREVFERLVIHYLKNYEMQEFEGVISGVNNAGVFVNLEEFGVQGFIPRHILGREFFIFDEERQRYFGKSSKKSYQLGEELRVLLQTADPTTCNLHFTLVQKTPKRIKKK